MKMKSILAVGAAALCGTVFADVTSANIVGYMTKDTNQKANQSYAPTFITVGANATYKLGDMKLQCWSEDDGEYTDGGSYRSDFIQFLDPTSSVIDPHKVYTYYGVKDGADPEGAYPPGWYTYCTDFPDEDDVYSNDIEFPMGTTFLCCFDPSFKSKFNYAGQVVVDNVTIETAIMFDEVKTWVANMFLANPYPVDLTLGDMSAQCWSEDDGEYTDGGSYRSDFIQFINPESSVIDPHKVYTYYGVKDGADPEGAYPPGWYTYCTDFPDEDDVYSNDLPFAAGEGFLCCFDPAFKTKLTIKSPIKK